MHDRKSLDYAPSASGPRSRADARGSRLSRSEHPAGKAVRARQRILAVFLPVTAVLYISCEALDPRGTDQVVTSMAVAFRLLPIAAAHPSRLYLAGSLSLLALGGLAVSYAAIALLVTGRGWVIATAGGDAGSRGRVRRGPVQRPGRGQPRGGGVGAHDPDGGRPVPGDQLRLGSGPGG